MDNNQRKQYVFRDTDFVYRTNLAGEYREEDMYHTEGRSACIRIPSEEMAEELKRDGFKVKYTKENPEYDRKAEPYVNVKLKFKEDKSRGTVKRNPRIGVFRDDNPEGVSLNYETVGQLDNRRDENGLRKDGIRIKENGVTCVCSPYIKQGKQPTLYINELYVKQDLDNDQNTGDYDSLASEFPLFDD